MTLYLPLPRLALAPETDPSENCLGSISPDDWSRLRGCQLAESGLTALPITCAFQVPYRTAGDTETTLCTLPPGTCSVQALRSDTDRTRLVTCSEPNCVLVDWQLVETKPVPTEEPVHFVVVDPEIESPDAFTDLSREMADRNIDRFRVVDRSMSPLGVASRRDLITAGTGAETGK